MALGDGIRRNVATVDPAERALLRDALIELNHRFFAGTRNDMPIAGGVSWWFKQDEIHKATHVHGNANFIPWHRELVHRFEVLLRAVDPRLSLHYWDWTQDPRAIPRANLGDGVVGTLNLFTPDFMGYGGFDEAPIGEPWLSAGVYVPGAAPHRDATNNPADPPSTVVRSVGKDHPAPASLADDLAIVFAATYPEMRSVLELVHNDMHDFVNMGGAHVSFRDPFVFLLHSNLDRLFALWQTDPQFPGRLDPERVYVPEDVHPLINATLEPWAGDPGTVRPWAIPERVQEPKTCKHPSIVAPPRYDTLQPRLVLQDFGFRAGGWRVDRHPRMLAPLTRSRCADIVGFGDAGVYVAYNNGDGTFRPAEFVIPDLGYEAGGWRVDRHPRLLAVLTPSGCADIVGFGNAGVYVAYNNGDGTFRQPVPVLEDLGYEAGGWRVDRHPRMLAPLTRSGCADIVAFGDAGV